MVQPKKEKMMKKIFKADKWKVIQEGFDNSVNEIAESVTSLGNGHMASEVILKRTSQALH